MSWILTSEDVKPEDRPQVGGKGWALSLLAKGGFNTPKTVCVISDAYREFIDKTGLRERIFLELHRKDFKEMRHGRKIQSRHQQLYTRQPGPLECRSQAG